jgi:hypothetical protein
MIILIDLLNKESLLVEEDKVPKKEEPSKPKQLEGFVDLGLEIVIVIE